MYYVTADFIWVGFGSPHDCSDVERALYKQGTRLALEVTEGQLKYLSSLLTVISTSPLAVNIELRLRVRGWAEEADGTEISFEDDNENVACYVIPCPHGGFTALLEATGVNVSGEFEP